MSGSEWQGHEAGSAQRVLLLLLLLLQVMMWLMVMLVMLMMQLVVMRLLEEGILRDMLLALRERIHATIC